MDIQGKITAVLPERSGLNAKGAWKAQEYLLETLGDYPKKVLFTVFGAERIDRFNIQVGQVVIASIDIDAHEYNGKWFNQIRAYDVRISQAPQQSSNVVYANNVPLSDTPPF